jgi:alpha-L-fucosidase 2
VGQREIASVKIKSSMGGNCRLRSYVPLKGKGLKEAKGQNTNLFYQAPDVAKPLIHSEIASSPLAVKKVYEYDLSTKKGDVIEISKQ